MNKKIAVAARYTQWLLILASIQAPLPQGVFPAGWSIGYRDFGGQDPKSNGNVGGGDRKDAGLDAKALDPNKIYTGRDVSSKAQILSKPRPQYTEDAQKNEVSGIVIIRAVFASSGQVTNIRAVNSLPYGLTEKAIAAARQIKFVPATRDGRRVSMYMQIEYTFDLVYKEGEVTQRAVITSQPQPEYTTEARAHAFHGTIILNAVLTKTGEIEDIEVDKPLPYGLTEKVVAAARRIRFEPATKDSHPVSQYTTLEYRF